jgi:hypothetical protein
LKPDGLPDGFPASTSTQQRCVDRILNFYDIAACFVKFADRPVSQRPETPGGKRVPSAAEPRWSADADLDTLAADYLHSAPPTVQPANAARRAISVVASESIADALIDGSRMPFQRSRSEKARQQVIKRDDPVV